MPFHPPKNQRLDPALYQQPNRVTFITVRAYQQTVPFQQPPLCRMAVNTLLAEQDRLACTLLAYCLMPNHLHYLIHPTMEGNSVLRFTDQYKGKTTHRSWELGWTGKLWEPRSYDHLVRSDERLEQLVAYILHNPVRKGLVTDPGEWPWSGSFA